MINPYNPNESLHKKSILNEANNKTINFNYSHFFQQKSYLNQLFKVSNYFDKLKSNSAIFLSYTGKLILKRKEL
jgi:hypothetical protein